MEKRERPNNTTLIRISRYWHRVLKIHSAKEKTSMLMLLGKILNKNYKNNKKENEKYRSKIQ